MGLLGCVAYYLFFTSSFLCNETYINKMELSPSIFVPELSKASCRVRFWDSICIVISIYLLVSYFRICRTKEFWLAGNQDHGGMLSRLRVKILNVLYFH